MQESNSIFLPDRGRLCFFAWLREQCGSNQPPNLSRQWHLTHCQLCCFSWLSFISSAASLAISHCYWCLQSSLFLFLHQHTAYPTSIFPFFAFLCQSLPLMPFLLPCQRACLPAPPQTLHFLSFPLGLKSCRGSLGWYFVPQLYHYKNRNVIPVYRGLKLGQWQKLLCVVFIAVPSGQSKRLVSAWFNHQCKQGGISNTLPI